MTFCGLPHWIQVVPLSEKLALTQVEMPALRRHARQNKSVLMGVLATAAAVALLAVGVLSANRKLPVVPQSWGTR